jgi:hypothetical protein
LYLFITLAVFCVLSIQLDEQYSDHQEDSTILRRVISLSFGCLFLLVGVRFAMLGHYLKKKMDLISDYSRKDSVLNVATWALTISTCLYALHFYIKAGWLPDLMRIEAESIKDNTWYFPIYTFSEVIFLELFPMFCQIYSVNMILKEKWA